MGLEVWMPLNGDTRNIGLRDYTSYETSFPGTDRLSTGINKLGRSIYFNGTFYTNIGPLNDIFGESNGNSYSICFWIYNNTSGQHSVILGNYPSASTITNGFALEVNGVTSTTYNALRLIHYRNSTCVYDTELDSATFQKCVLNVNTWVHIAFVVNPDSFSVYKNGTHVYTVQQKLQGVTADDFFLGYDLRGTHLKGYMNDFRIYDYALTEREIKEIYKTLIMHIKFDNNGIPCGKPTEYRSLTTSECSGYGGRMMYGTNNSTIDAHAAGDFGYCVSPIYGAAITFTGAQSSNPATWVESSPIFLNGYKNSCTISYWFCSGSNSNGSGYMINRMPWGLNRAVTSGKYASNINIFNTSSVICLNVGDSANNPIQTDAGANISQAPFYNMQWHHVVITFNGSKNSIYIDGAYVGHSKTYYSLTRNDCENYDYRQYVNFSGWNRTANSYRYWGSIADFRMYSTVLSATDILELYKMGNNKAVSGIDRNGTVFGTNFIEDGSITR